MDCTAVCWREILRNCLQPWMAAVKPPGMGSRRVSEYFLTIKRGEPSLPPSSEQLKCYTALILLFLLNAFEDSSNTLAKANTHGC